MIILDSTALVSFLLLEPGGEAVGQVINDAAMSTVGLAEMISRFERDSIAVDELLSQLSSTNLKIIPFDERQAVTAGKLISQGRIHGLSIADTAALALAIDQNCPIMTKVKEWADLELPIEVRVLQSGQGDM